MNTRQGKNKGLANGLGVLQSFVGVGAVGGGLGLILEPSGSNLGTPLEMLENSPFDTYLIPGIVLFAVNGLGSLVGAAATFTRHKYAGEAAVALGLFLVVWIILQVYWISALHWLHVLYIGLGISEIVLGWFLRKAFLSEYRSAARPDATSGGGRV
jgi:hypothetical protein